MTTTNPFATQSPQPQTEEFKTELEKIAIGAMASASMDVFEGAIAAGVDVNGKRVKRGGLLQEAVRYAADWSQLYWRSNIVTRTDLEARDVAVNMAKRLLEEGAKSDGVWTVSSRIANQPDLVKTLLNHGAKFRPTHSKDQEIGAKILANALVGNLSSESGELYKPDFEVAEKLVNAGACPTRALSLVAGYISNPQADSVWNWLLDRGADPSHSIVVSNTIVVSSMVHSKISAKTLERVLDRGFPLEQRYEEAWTMLMAASQSDATLDKTDVLIRHGADLNASYWNDREGLNLTALDAAAMNGATKTVHRLIDAGMSPNGLADARMPPIMLAWLERKDDTMEALVQRGASTEPLSPSFARIYQTLGRSGRKEDELYYRFLTENGVEWLKQDEQDQIIIRLVTLCADRDIRRAVSLGFSDDFAALEKRTGKSLVDPATMFDRLLETVLEYGADPRAYNQHGCSALAEALDHKRWTNAILLMRKGAVLEEDAPEAVSIDNSEWKKLLRAFKKEQKALQSIDMAEAAHQAVLRAMAGS